MDIAESEVSTELWHKQFDKAIVYEETTSMQKESEHGGPPHVVERERFVGYSLTWGNFLLLVVSGDHFLLSSHYFFI